MMKVLTSFALGLLLLIMAASPTLAASATPAAEATPAAKVDPIAQDLLDRVATKVAELTDRLKRTYQGRVKSVGTTSYVLTTSEGDKTILTNDVTDFYRIRSGRTSTINFAGIKAGDDLVAIGTLDGATNEITAREIIAKIARQNIAGKITTNDDGVITITSGDKNYQVDLNDATTLRKASASGQLSTAKLADFIEGSTVFVMAYESTDPDILSALKALLLLK